MIPISGTADLSERSHAGNVPLRRACQSISTLRKPKRPLSRFAPALASSIRRARWNDSSDDDSDYTDYRTDSIAGVSAPSSFPPLAAIGESLGIVSAPTVMMVARKHLLSLRGGYARRLALTPTPSPASIRREVCRPKSQVPSFSPGGGAA